MVRIDSELPATDAEVASRSILHDIIRGKLEPDQRLRVKDLSARYGISASPMREALSKLSGGPLVRLEGQKGFRVASLDVNDLMDITRTRQLVEAQALTLSIEAADDNWEADVVKSFHLLSLEVDRRGEGSAEWLDAFESRHHQFHHALIANCPLKALTVFCDELYLRAERYRRIMFGYSFERGDIIEEHKNLLNAALSKDIDTARGMLVKHIALTSDILAELLSSPRAR